LGDLRPFYSKLKGLSEITQNSQMQLAELCDSSTGYIGEIESGKRFLSIDMIEWIAAALKIESYFLFKNEPIGSSTSNLSIKLAPS
jgi:transcriptional regulator with XRE-family HTH domain